MGLQCCRTYDWFVLPAVSLAGTSNPTLTFDYAYAYYDQTNGSNVAYDSLYVAYSLDCGTTWTSLFYEGGTQLATAGGWVLNLFQLLINGKTMFLI